MVRAGDPEHAGALGREPGDRGDQQPHARRAAAARAELSNEPVPADVGSTTRWRRCSARTDFPAGPWTEIYYEASGTAEQTAYYGVTARSVFTPELTPGFDGLERFHPPYEFVVDQYLGTDFYEGSSIRAAYLTALTRRSIRHGTP